MVRAEISYENAESVATPEKSSRFGTVRNHLLEKTKLGQFDMKKKKMNKEGAGKPLSYPKSVDEELVAWILRMNDLNLSCSSKLLVAKYKVLVTPRHKIRCE